jgi:hypothetical protein
VYFGNRGSLTAQPYALLNADDLGTSGSEVITVQQFNQGGPYQASVFNYGNQSTTSTNLSTASGLSLKIINGGTVVSTSGGGSTVQGGTLVASLTPTPDLAGNTWLAVYIDPATGKVTLVNQIINTTDGITPTDSETAALTLENLSTASAATFAAPEAANVEAPAVVGTAPAATSAAVPAMVSTTPIAVPAVLSPAPVATPVGVPAVVSTTPVATTGAAPVVASVSAVAR